MYEREQIETAGTFAVVVFVAAVAVWAAVQMEPDTLEFCAWGLTTTAAFAIGRFLWMLCKE